MCGSLREGNFSFDQNIPRNQNSSLPTQYNVLYRNANIQLQFYNFKVNARDDEDDVFVERASEKRSAKASEREIKRAIGEHKRTEKILNSCRYCFESEEMLKHLFIAKGEKVQYFMFIYLLY